MNYETQLHFSPGDWSFINPNWKVLGGIIFLAQMKFNTFQYGTQLSLMLWFEKRDGLFLIIPICYHWQKLKGTLVEKKY